MAAIAAKKRVVYIGGTGRSGSTLLDLLLSRHSTVQSLGEIHRLSLCSRENREPCTCGQPVAQCDFWRNVENIVRKQLGWHADRRPLLETEVMLRKDAVGSLASAFERAALCLASPALARGACRLFAPAHYRAIETSLLWYDAIREATGKPVIVDSSKDARRLKLLYLAAPEQYRLIYLVRDGRAVCASTIRRTGVPMEDAAKMWRRSHRAAQWARRGIPDESVLYVKYETLCTEPRATMQRILEFIGLDFESSVLTLQKEQSHNIGGNPMRFRKDECEIRLDQRWKQELTPEQLRIFQAVAGRTNRRLGYC